MPRSSLDGDHPDPGRATIRSIGAHPGQAQAEFSYMLNGPATEEERASHLQDTNFAIELLRGEDFFAEAQCQAGFEAGRDSLALGSNEPLLQHIHGV